MRILVAIIGCVLLPTLGCNEPSSGGASTTKATAAPPPPPPPAGDAADAKKIQADDNVVKAEVGAGKKGRGYGGGYISEFARARFRAADRIEFARMEHAIQLYKATNNGLPKTHDQFMTEIIETNQIKLPQLPAGEEYIYDPKAGELMVRRPK